MPYDEAKLQLGWKTGICNKYSLTKIKKRKNIKGKEGKISKSHPAWKTSSGISNSENFWNSQEFGGSSWNADIKPSSSALILKGSEN